MENLKILRYIIYELLIKFSDGAGQTCLVKILCAVHHYTVHSHTVHRQHCSVDAPWLSPAIRRQPMSPSIGQTAARANISKYQRKY